MFEIIVCVCLGMIISYWIPTFSVRLLKKTSPVSAKSRWMMVGLFLFFAALSVWKGGTSTQFYLFIPLLLVLLLIGITDYWFGLIPNVVTYPAILFFGWIRWWWEPKLFFHYLVSMFISGLGILFIAIATKGIGIGDAKLVGLGGLVVGLPEIFFAIWFATISGMMYIIWRWLIGKKIGRKTPFPFGPHLALGIGIAYLYDDQLMHLFLLFG